MNLINFADASRDELLSMMTEADINNSDSYLFNNDIERNMYIHRRYNKYEQLGGRDNILNTIVDACQEIQYYVDRMLAMSYELILIDRDEIQWYQDEGGEYETTNVIRNHNNISFEINRIEDSIKIYYKLGRLHIIDLLIY